MKVQRKPALLIMAMLLALLFSACHTPQNIIANLDLYNLKPGIDTFRKHHAVIHNGDVVTVRINNVNKDLYTVKLTHSVISYNTTIPSALNLSSIVLPGFITPTALHTATRHRPDCSELVELEKDNIDSEMVAFKQAENNLNKVIAYNNLLLLLQKDCDFYDIMAKADFALQDMVQSVDISLLPKFIDDNFAGLQDAYSRIDQSITAVDVYFNCDSCKATLAKKHTQNFTETQKAAFAEMKDNYKSLLTFMQTGQQFLVVQNYKALANASNYRFSAVDTAKNADEVNFNITISPKNWMPCRAVDTSFNINLKVARFKIDFSTGVFLNWGGSAFSGKNYFVDSTGTIRQISKNANSYIPSVGALAHFYYRSTTAIDPGVVLGASLSTDVKYTNFHIGLSFMFNAHNEIFNRVALSGGLTYRYVDQLNSGYGVGTAIDKSLTIDQVESGKFIRGGFLALTYNLSK